MGGIPQEFDKDAASAMPDYQEDVLASGDLTKVIFHAPLWGYWENWDFN